MVNEITSFKKFKYYHKRSADLMLNSRHMLDMAIQYNELCQHIINTCDEKTLEEIFNYLQVEHENFLNHVR